MASTSPRYCFVRCCCLLIMNTDYLNKHRLRDGMYGTDDSFGFNGAFFLKLRGAKVKCIASDGGGWRHVSVSIEKCNQPPSWQIMCDVKNLFWEAEDCVVQFHPPQSKYVNFHNGCLHLWQPYDESTKTVLPYPQPPQIMV